ncbi:MAG TPA: hypothetical protein VFI28_06735 [Candidatus Limnocylindrales bacterium]|nr:hypothetical protein [Candidatus Limnocylindrales bacterium]
MTSRVAARSVPAAGVTVPPRMDPRRTPPSEHRLIVFWWSTSVGDQPVVLSRPVRIN